MNGNNKILLWIGMAIAITVGVAWALVQAHNHPQLLSRTEFMQDIVDIKQDVRELRAKQAHQLDAILEALKDIHGNDRRDSHR